MKIAVINLTGGGLSGGYRKYILQLAPVFQNNPAVSSAVFFVHQALRETKGLERLHVQTWPARDHLFGYRRLKASLRELAPDVIFIPSARWISVGNIPTVVMVRNMEPLEVPFGDNPLLEKIRNVGRAWEAKSACRHATRIIAVSQHVKDFLVSRWVIAPEKVGVVYHGIDQPPAMTESGISGDRPAQLSGIPDDFIFTAGSIRPARGLEDLVAALDILACKGRRCTAVIAGGLDRGMEFYKNKLGAIAAAAGIEKQIVWTGALTPADMAWCYRHCSVFVMTTHAEACPNTALEAMAHGCLSVVTDKAPLPEFFANASIYYKGGDPGDLAAGMARARALNELERREFRDLGIARARNFSWSDTARLTIQELALAAGAAFPVRSVSAP